MTDYYMGIAVGGTVGYALAVITLFGVWGLCVIAKKAEEEDKQ